MVCSVFSFGSVNHIKTGKNELSLISVFFSIDIMLNFQSFVNYFKKYLI